MNSPSGLTRRFRHSSEETAAVVLLLRLPIEFGEETAAAVLPLRLTIEFACLPIEC